MNTQSSLLSGGEQSPLLPALRRALSQATEIEIAVSFIRSSGLDLIFGDLEVALCSQTRRVKLTILTSDYMSVTDPRALRRLMLLVERGASIRVYETDGSDSFHLKAYIFVRTEHGRLAGADVFVGSSNLSAKALTDGLERSFHLVYPNEADTSSERQVNEIRQRFRQLQRKPQVQELSFEWIERYQARHEQAQKVLPFDQYLNEKADNPTPRLHQRHALAALHAARTRGMTKGLVVLATGMGKTYLAAFDARQMQAGKILFVAHREEILLQAQESFLGVMPRKRVGMYGGKQKDPESDLLFASIQTMGRAAHLERFGKDHFDYIIVDEFHHAAAGSYQRLLAYFRPRFLLGLTATPDRTDGSDILQLCDNNLVYRRDLFDGISDGQLSLFSYYGIFDKDVNYEHIPWRNGRFEPDALSNQLATRGRARHALTEWQDKAQLRTLAFCVSQKHADFMATYFCEAGVQAGSVHSDSEITRSEALEQLARGKLKVLFSVDLFNEGVDLPQIDTVMMLRPTESRILFLQQLGRGLRPSEGKDRLVVIDFVGNHHSFLNRPEMLLGSVFTHRPTRKQLVDVAQRASEVLPAGCYVNYDLEFIEFLDSLVQDNLGGQYRRLRQTLGRRPTLLEFWRSGATLSNLRRNYGSWWEFVDEQGDASAQELAILESCTQWFRDLTVTRVSSSIKLVMLQVMCEHNAFGRAVTIQELARWIREWLLLNPRILVDSPLSLQPLENVSEAEWVTHLRKTAVNDWCEAESGMQAVWFRQDGLLLRFSQRIDPGDSRLCGQMTSEILAWRLSAHLQALETDSSTNPLASAPASSQANLQARVGEYFMREQIPPLFGKQFNPGNWSSGHVVLRQPAVQILLVTLNKQGKATQHRYHDYFMDEAHFHWQSQNSTSPNSNRGMALIRHSAFGSRIYLFVRENKLGQNKKAAPFRFYGEVDYVRHEGSQPMSIVWKLQDPGPVGEQFDGAIANDCANNTR
ncbi:DUF3427 domain-containing protein [Orrella marina]|uniref:DUF3427 domain-containing protein n=1 Tax=Orrella marina TaxID=2163011 RepID=A0A2R4XM10_9BURK|nr:DUF3427 domain-containing protein [Orrella marina]AWB34837.1 DUF3427 domain-containing protein [Orrella marina]